MANLKHKGAKPPVKKPIVKEQVIKEKVELQTYEQWLNGKEPTQELKLLFIEYVRLHGRPQWFSSQPKEE